MESFRNNCMDVRVTKLPVSRISVSTCKPDTRNQPFVTATRCMACTALGSREARQNLMLLYSACKARSMTVLGLYRCFVSFWCKRNALLVSATNDIRQLIQSITWFSFLKLMWWHFGFGSKNAAENLHLETIFAAAMSKIRFR